MIGKITSGDSSRQIWPSRGGQRIRLKLVGFSLSATN
jgi:hypothetical protein